MDEAHRWRTQFDADHLSAFGVGEAHGVFFEPVGDRPGPAPSVTVLIPESSSAKIKSAMAHARQRKARVVFVCDTRHQADEIANRASAMLPGHKRIAFERAQAGRWGVAV